MERVLWERIKALDGLIDRMKENKEIGLVEILREEIERLRRLNEEYEEVIQRKRVKSKEESEGKVKYWLNDGSVYVVNKDRKYKYLYDKSSGVVTYEFGSGQIERTFPGGIKEIRTADGKIIVKNSEKEYDIVNK
ncbi:hypothetical protein NEHOM01_2031 [Nematocida homosporus]|uniref:uncharacterized protein n=1 Tax=Nematocida homosporus TaxID=1912981 RepID=UPI002220D1B8|nr:uncharacterized protein NEHOM01_2031 [Nematocida homosporus]KAI5187235.1 hypothetical protein NEHOM01_2031 [Nematocida homosporus]